MLYSTCIAIHSHVDHLCVILKGVWRFHGTGDEAIAIAITQWRVQDLKEGGAKPIAREARLQNFKPCPNNVDHTPHYRVLKESWLTKKAILAK